MPSWELNFMDFWGQKFLEFALCKWQANPSTNQESIHLHVGFACFFSHSCGFFRVKLHGSQLVAKLQDMETLLMLRCCWCFFVAGFLKTTKWCGKITTSKLYHIVILIQKRLPPKIVFPECQKSVFQEVRRSTSLRHLSGICYLHSVIMWRVPSFGKIHAPCWVVLKHWVFPCGMWCPVLLVP